MDIYCPTIPNEYDYGGSASLKMRIMVRLISRALLAFLGSFVSSLSNQIWYTCRVEHVNIISYGFYHNHQNFMAIFSDSTHLKSPLALSCAQYFRDHFQMLQGHSLPYDLGQVGLWRFGLIKYEHNGPFNELVNFSIPEPMFNPRPIRPKGCCHHTRLSICPSVRLFPSSLLTQ